MKVSFLGAGNMAEAVIKGALSAKIFKAKNILAADVSRDRLNYLRATYGIRTSMNNKEALKHGSVVILGVKPLTMDHLLKEVAGQAKSGHLFISVAAGITIARIRAILGKGARVIRVMPNTPALIREGATAIAPGKGVTKADIALALKLFNSIGRAVLLEEKMMDAVTGLSGSGPAFVFVMIEAMADGGVKMGLPRDVSLFLAAQTVLGSARMVLETKEHPGKLKDFVASPGGTTIAGLHRLEEGRIRAALIAAVEGATRRSEELGRSF